MKNGEGYYAVRLTQSRDTKGELWTAEHIHLLGCHAVGRTAQEAMDDLTEVRAEWIDRAKLAGRTVPDPQPVFKYNMVLAPDHTAEEARCGQDALKTAGELPVARFGVLA